MKNISRKIGLTLAVAAVLAVGVIGGLLAQQTTYVPTVASVGSTDLFQDVVGGSPSAQSVYATAGQITDTVSIAYSVPLTGFAITQGVGVNRTIINPAGTLATGGFTFNATPTNGASACFSSTQTVTAATFTGNTGQTVTGAPTTMSAGTSVCFIYVASVSTWFKV
jgi:hypothetical protein